MTDSLILESHAAAFGDASHPTTRLMLEAIDAIANTLEAHDEPPPARICDMGCGSGILSLRAAQCWSQAHIVAADVLRESVAATHANAIANGISPNIASPIRGENLSPHRGLNTKLLVFKDGRGTTKSTDLAHQSPPPNLPPNGGGTFLTPYLSLKKGEGEEVDPRPQGGRGKGEGESEASEGDKKVSEGGLRIIHSDGFNHPDIRAIAPYDLILMNILADPILRLLYDAEQHLAQGGLLLLSGMLVWQEQQIMGAAQSLELELAQRLVAGDWVSHLWVKP